MMLVSNECLNYIYTIHNKQTYDQYRKVPQIHLITKRH